MATKTLLTLKDFEQLPDDGRKYELDEGELVSMPPPEERHTETQWRVVSLLNDFAERNKLGKARPEMGFLLSTDPASFRIPDVSFIRSSRMRPRDAAGYFLGAPDLAVEIVSPSQTPAMLLKKVGHLLEAGTHTVWILNPKKNQVHVFEATGAIRVLDHDQILDAPDLLPGFSVAVSTLFE